LVCALTSSSPKWIAATRVITAGCIAFERAQLFEANAKRIWRLLSARVLIFFVGAAPSAGGHISVGIA
jgi:hypothetical protein